MAELFKQLLPLRFTLVGFVTEVACELGVAELVALSHDISRQVLDCLGISRVCPSAEPSQLVLNVKEQSSDFQN
jgi:hypothetical protein